MTRQRLALVVAAALALGSWTSVQGSEQDGSQPPPNSSGPTNSSSVQAGATAGSNSAAVINQNGATIPRQFVSATPGVISPAAYPGIPIPNSAWQVYYSAVQHVWTMTEIDRMRRKFHFGDILPENWKKRIRAVVTDPDLVPSNNNPIQIVQWWAQGIAYPGDHEVGRVDAVCDPLVPEEECLGLALAEAKRLTHTSRVSIRARLHLEGVTKGLSFGAGGTAARITQPGLDNDAVGLATGGLIGTNRTRVDDYIEFDIICLNDGPVVPPQPPPQVVAQVPPPPPPPVQVVRYEFAPIQVVVAPIKFDLPTLPAVAQFAPPPPPPPAPRAEEACDAWSTGIPQLTVYFDFDMPMANKLNPKLDPSDAELMASVKPEYLPKLREFLGWLDSHRKCHIQVEGHTCRSGGFDYDAALARRRAKAVYLQLIANGGDPRQIEQFPSLGKDRVLDPTAPLTSEYEAPNRRVTLRIIGPASGK